MRILVTNDDGIYSPGIAALATAAAEFGEVTVVAPDAEQSAVGQAISILRPVYYRHSVITGMPRDVQTFRVNGTPSDCVALGLVHWGGADLVLSGINLGSNLGHDVWYSGTVAATKQAAILGVPAAALSLQLTEDESVFRNLTAHLNDILKMVMALPKPFLVNINLPPKPQGIVWTRQSVRHYQGSAREGRDPMSRRHFWLNTRPLSDPEEGTDRWAVDRGYTAVTPLRHDLTDEDWLKSVGGPCAPAGAPRE